MFKNISKAGKALLLTLGAGTVGGLAYTYYSTTNTNKIQPIIPSVAVQLKQSMGLENIGGVAKEVHVVVDSHESVDGAKVQNKHQHDTDVRVLDMVGLPAVHGSNILEAESTTQQDNHSGKQPISQSKNQTGQPISDKQNDQVQAPTQNSSVSQQEPATILQINRISKKITLNKLAQIPLLDNIKKIANQPYILIIPDPGYTSMFEAELTTKITKILKNRNSSEPLTIYRIDTRNRDIVEQFQNQFKTKIKQQDIYLLRNPYDINFVNIDFDMFLKHQRIPGIYLNQLKYKFLGEDLKKQILKMTANDTYLLLTIDTTNQDIVNKSKLTAKYIEMQLGVESYQNIKVCLIDINQAKSAGIVSEQTKPNTLHLIRKGNQFTYKTPNRWLFGNRPYHVMENISLQDKNHTLMIPRYLSKIQTFSSMRLDSPYICMIHIDRNKTTPREQRQILKVLAQIKEKQEFPMVSFVLKFGQTQYKGAQEQEFSNKRWSLKLANVDEIDKHSFMHEIKKIEDSKTLGITQKTWLRDSYQYLYKDPEITEEGVRNFFGRVLDGKQPQYFKSEGKFKLQHVEKATGENFNETILNNEKKSHLVFQYSDHCQACQALSPLIEYFADICYRFPDLETNVHALNCEKNKVKGQPYSPYTPNLYLYSKNWKNKTPMRYPIIEYINHNNIWGIYDFCMITDQLRKIDLTKFEEHVKNITENKVKLTDF